MGPGAGRNATAGPGKGARRVTRAAAAWTPSPGSSLRFTDDAGDSSSEEVSGATSEGAGGVHARPMQAAPGSQERAQATGSRAVAPPVRPADASTDASSLGAWDRTRSGPSSATALGPPQATASSSGEPDTHSTWTSSDWTGDGVSRRKGPTPASSAARPDPPHTHRTPAKGGVRLPATSPQGTRGADSTERSVDRAAGTVAAADLLRRIRRAVALHRSTDTAEGRSQPGGSLRESKESEAGAESSSGAAGLRGWLHAGAGVADAAKGPVQGDGATRQELQEIWDLLRSSAEGAAALGGGDGLGRDAGVCPRLGIGVTVTVLARRGVGPWLSLSTACRGGRAAGDPQRAAVGAVAAPVAAPRAASVAAGQHRGQRASGPPGWNQASGCFEQRALSMMRQLCRRGSQFVRWRSPLQQRR